MAITSAITNTFITEILRGDHDLTVTTGDTLKIALYVTATMDKTTTAYTTTNEVAAGGGYTQGDKVLVSVTPTYDTTASICDFVDAEWTSSTITAEGCMIYNTSSTITSNAAIMVLDFGGSKSSSSGSFTVQFPAYSVGNAIIQITN